VLLVKLIGGKNVTIENVNTHDTVETVMSRIYDKEGVRDGKLMFQGKELLPAARLVDCGIKVSGTVLHHVVKTRGGPSAIAASGFKSFAFTDMKPLEDKKEVAVKDFAPDAPTHRQCQPGLFAMVVCKRADCKVKNEWVVHNLGIGTYNIAMVMHEVECPVCKTVIKPDEKEVTIRWAVNLCDWRFKGFTDKHQQHKSKDWIRAGQGYYLFEDTAGTVDYIALEIQTRALPKS